MMRPDSSDAVRGMAALSLERKNYEEAYELHRRLIDLGEKSPERRCASSRRGRSRHSASFVTRHGVAAGVESAESNGI